MRRTGYAYGGVCVHEGVMRTTGCAYSGVGYAYSGYAYSAGTPSHPMRSGAVIRCCDQVLRSSGAVKFCGHLSCEGGGSDTQRALRLLRLTPCCSKNRNVLGARPFFASVRERCAEASRVAGRQKCRLWRLASHARFARRGLLHGWDKLFCRTVDVFISGESFTCGADLLPWNAK